MSVKFTRKAREHIRTIKLYSLRRWEVSVVEAYANSLRVAMTEILARHPSPGRDRSDDLHVGGRSFPVESHIIYYREVRLVLRYWRYDTRHKNHITTCK
jgi:toxin ParE1/3/4